MGRASGEKEATISRREGISASLTSPAAAALISYQPTGPWEAPSGLERPVRIWGQDRGEETFGFSTFRYKHGLASSDERERDLERWAKELEPALAVLERIERDGLPAGNMMNAEVARLASTFRHGDTVFAPWNAVETTETVQELTKSGWLRRREVPAVRVEGRIYQRGVHVGRYARVFYQKKKTGPIEASHRWLYLDPSVQGEGIAQAFQAHSEQMYAERGVRRVHVCAGGTVGGYSWAKADYGFEGAAESIDMYALSQRAGYLQDVGPERQAAASVWFVYGGRDRALLALIDGRIPAELFDQADQFFTQIKDGKLPAPTPDEITRFGENLTWTETPQLQLEYGLSEPGRERSMWLGKAIMLGSEWNGLKDIPPRRRPRAKRTAATANAAA